jgi:hypothetical protein
VAAVVGTQENWVLCEGREACWLAWLMQGGGHGYEATRLLGWGGTRMWGHGNGQGDLDGHER